jgi:hypothetical protein
VGRRARPSLVTSISAIVAAVGLYSAWHAGGHVWRSSSSVYRTYAGYTGLQRQHAPIDGIPLPSEVFDFYAAHVRRGDRIYFQVVREPFGNYLDLPGIVAATGRFYLLPAVQVTDPRRATVVLSWRADPRRLHLRYATQARLGAKPFIVSRVAGR